MAVICGWTGRGFVLAREKQELAARTAQLLNTSGERGKHVIGQLPSLQR